MRESTIIVTGPRRDDGYHPCRITVYSEAQQRWIEFQEAIVIHDEGQELVEGERYKSIEWQFGDEHCQPIPIYIVSGVI